MQKNPEIELAWNFVINTDRNIFLTGKAGTGKTTFLHRLRNESLKRMVVVAPTGVAAINAKGVTIHSFFQLPFGPILPDDQMVQNRFSKKFSSIKINIIKSLDLLVIDEISMVRADVLDGIDQVLKRYRDRSKPFGGVQLLMIGDLQQLAPVIKDDEWQVLKYHYNTGFFFGSRAFQDSNALAIELKHIYRQEDLEFIKILNEIRNNTLTPESSIQLNKRYLPNFNPSSDERYITLTTHNNRADRINASELNKLKSKSFVYEAQIGGNFPEYMFPTHPELSLKVGSQVMFIKNDSSPEKRYFNGKIGKVMYLDKEEIVVRCPGEKFDISTTQEVWENIKYSLHPETKEIIEERAGSFTQIPLRLAWAITIHKSQGLTFDKIIIDAQEAFAHGQTYVAFSRCTSLEGIVLTGPINPNSIINNLEVVSFSKNAEAQQPNNLDLESSKRTYQLNLIDEIFDYYPLGFPVGRVIDIFYQHRNSIQGNLVEKMTILKEEVPKLLQIKTKFKSQLENLCGAKLPESSSELQERFKKAVSYFEERTNSFKKLMSEIQFATDNRSIKENIEKHLETIENFLSVKIYCFQGLQKGFNTSDYLSLRAKALLQKEEKPKSRKTEIPVKVDHPILFESLRDLRMTIADVDQVAPFQIFTQKALFEMCQVLPRTLKQLGAISDIGKVRLQKYGKEILKAINAYCIDQDIEAKAPVITLPKKNSSQQISFDLFKSGMNITEIARERKLANSTIEGHLAAFVPTGEIKITEVMPQEKFLELKKLMETIPFEGFGDLKSKIDDKFTYADLRLVSNALEFERNETKLK